MSNQTEIPMENHCQHFVLRKKRFCRMTIKTGHKYCGEHEPTSNSSLGDSVGNERIRISCPLDPTHSCYASKLSKHLKICNAKVTSHPPFIEKGVNLGYNPETENDESRLELSVISTDEVLSVITKINTFYDEFINQAIKSSNHRHTLLDEECNEVSYGPNKRRHLVQTSALAGQLQNENFLVPNTCFIEFGGGKGQMTYWLAKISEDISNTNIILVDKASHRHKQDNKLENMKHRVHRIRADISDLVIEKLDCISKSENIIGVGKHLCGAATDLAFRCMVRYDKCKMSGLVLAFCCHHRCSWLTYTGRTWLESLGLGKKDFDIMCSISSWATCGTGLSRERRQNETDEYNDNSDISDKDIEPKSNEKLEATVKVNENGDIKRNRFGFTLQEREAVGRRTKHLMDYGRMQFLQNNGYSCEFIYYVPIDITPENLCIVAQRVEKLEDL